MPTVNYKSATFRYTRTWVRSGSGPKVANPFTYSMACIRSNNAPAVFTIANGGASTNVGGATTSQRLQLYQDLRERAYASMQAGADVGERRQTIDLIASVLRVARSPLKTVGDYMRKAAKRQGKDLGSMLLKDSADAYLAFQYGVKPLMGSIQDLCNVLNRPYPRHRVRGHAPRHTSTRPPSLSKNFPKGDLASIQQLRDVCDLHGGFDVVVKNQQLFSAEQMGLLNVASIAWELTTLSFVFDWFWPIGTYINSMSDYAGCSLTNSYTTEFVKTTGFRSYVNRGQSCSDESVKNVRTLGVPTLPQLITVPLHLEQSKQHVINALALLASNKRKLFLDRL